ncbi:hypothetical protein ACHAXR_007572 [Thalassiosira sp. AJA248-18]
MASQDQLIFDIVIVGGGPSAAGLLRGLLLRILANGQKNIRIAVLERGADSRPALCDKSIDGNINCTSNVNLEHESNDRQSHSVESSDQKQYATNQKRQRFGHSHPSTYSLKDWFTAAHYTSKPSNYIIEQGTEIPSSANTFNSQRNSSRNKYGSASPTVLHTTVPQAHLNTRIIDVPTGCGWGGTTNINAGLVMQPLRGDFANWPGRWKGGDVLQPAILEILEALDENGALSRFSMSFSGKNKEKATPNFSSFLEVCSNREVTSSTEGVSGIGQGDKFQEIMTSSTNLPTNEAGEGAAMPSKRVNYFSALVEPLLNKYPELESHVSFLSGVQVERILVGCGCDCALDGDQRAAENGGKSCCKCGNCNSKHAARAWAVECLVSDGESTNNHRVLIRSKQEIILCAGAIGSPSLLLASGIGHEDDLKAAGIKPWCDDLPSHLQGQYFRKLPVGHNLRDQIVLPRMFDTPCQKKATVSCNSIHGSWFYDLSTFFGYAKTEIQLADGVQMDSMAPHFAAAALRRTWHWPFWGREVPYILVSYTYYFLRYVLKVILQYFSFKLWSPLQLASINVCLLNPQSVGKVTIVSQASRENNSGSKKLSGATNDDIDTPVRLGTCRVMIDPGYLSDPRDMDALWKGWKTSNRVKCLWFGGCTEVLPGNYFAVVLDIVASLVSILQLLVPTISSNIRAKEDRPAWFPIYVSEFSNPYYHWCGTCAMGDGAADKDVGEHTSGSAHEGSFVVDEQFCVRGIMGLRVCDASIFPHCVSVPPALTCAALGYEASGFIVDT